MNILVIICVFLIGISVVSILFATDRIYSDIHEKTITCDFITYYVNNSNETDKYASCDTTAKEGYHAFMGANIQ